jgi:hypothetical protein
MKLQFYSRAAVRLIPKKSYRRGKLVSNLYFPVYFLILLLVNRLHLQFPFRQFLAFSIVFHGCDPFLYEISFNL